MHALPIITRNGIELDAFFAQASVVDSREALLTLLTTRFVDFPVSTVPTIESLRLKLDHLHNALSVSFQDKNVSKNEKLQLLHAYILFLVHFNPPYRQDVNNNFPGKVHILSICQSLSSYAAMKKTFSNHVFSTEETTMLLKCFFMGKRNKLEAAAMKFRVKNVRIHDFLYKLIVKECIAPSFSNLSKEDMLELVNNQFKRYLEADSADVVFVQKPFLYGGLAASLRHFNAEKCNALMLQLLKVADKITIPRVKSTLFHLYSSTVLRFAKPCHFKTWFHCLNRLYVRSNLSKRARDQSLRRIIATCYHAYYNLLDHSNDVSVISPGITKLCNVPASSDASSRSTGIAHFFLCTVSLCAAFNRDIYSAIGSYMTLSDVLKFSVATCKLNPAEREAAAALCQLGKRGHHSAFADNDEDSENTDVNISDHLSSCKRRLTFL